MAEDTRNDRSSLVTSQQLETDYPLIDSDPHFKRVFRYARPLDYVQGAAFAAFAPAFMVLNEKFAPSFASKSSIASVMRLSGAVGLSAGFLFVYQASILRFYGLKENAREIDMDMREMVEKVKKGEPLYGKPSMSPYMQGVSARNSRYSGLFIHLIPWFNFTNHDQHGVDTAKYYRQAERELEANSKQS